MNSDTNNPQLSKVSKEYDELKQQEDIEFFEFLEEENIENFDEKELEKIVVNLQDSTRKYLNEIGKIQLLTPEREKELFIRFQEGDTSVKNEIIESNLRLVVSIAKKYYDQNSSFTFLDIIQYGNEGLIKAVDKYDVYTGYKFSTYATYWINQSITRSIANENDIIRIPNGLRLQINNIRKYTNQYYNQYGFYPSIGECANKFNISEEKMIKIMSLNIKIISIEEPKKFNGEEQDIAIKDLIPADINIEKEIENKMYRDEILKGFSTVLTEREYSIIRYRMGFETGSVETLESVGKIFNLTKERVRQIEGRALKKIKKYIQSQNKTKIKKIEF